MKYKLFSGSAKNLINLCYEQYKPETNRIVIYNDSPRTIKSAEITLKNNTNNYFLYRVDRLEKKSGSLIDFGLQVDSNGIKFSGNLAEVSVKCSAGSFKFSPLEEKFFKLL